MPVDPERLATGSWDKTVRIWAVGYAGPFKCESTLNGYRYTPFLVLVLIVPPTGVLLSSDWGGVTLLVG